MAENLPFEVLVYIFKYLPRADRKAAGETCRTWNMVANDHCYVKGKLAVINKIELCDNTTSLEIFENSSMTINNYMFCDVEISSKVNSFWKKMGAHVKCLSLRNCDIHEKEFMYLLDKCENLEVLHIQGCKELFMSGCLLEGKTDGLQPNSLCNLRCLSLSENQYLTDALFNRFVKAAPALEDLNLSGSSVQFHYGLVRRFYPPGTDIFEKPSESVLTFYFILQFIISRASSIRSLQFSNTLLDGSAVSSIAQIEGLQLRYLLVSSCDQLTNLGIRSLVNHQKLLKELDISLCTRVTDQSLVLIADNLINLENLNIQRCRAVTDLGIIELAKLKRLKKLNISQMENITRLGFEKGICKEVNTLIQDLDISALNLDERAIIIISEKLPELRNLNMSYCFNGVTDTSIQMIFKNQIWMRKLRINHCDKVTDAGLTGMGKVDGDNNNPTSSEYVEPNGPQKIHLGSRAEEEIVRDAKRKLDVMRMCENLSMDSYSGYSLARMKGLKTLDIGGCNKITDVSLTYAFNHTELTSLNLSTCQQITVEGLKHLVKNCPSIEYLMLVDCFNLKDEGFIEIVKGLKRLTNLEVRGCNQLTDQAVEAIKTYCKKIKVLDLQGCRNISAEAACCIGNIPTLHTVLMSKPGPYITDGVKNRTPAPSFFPSFFRRFRWH
ncbi:F-box/LRR-repeat protein fbxl-1-like [Aricia agestis]|uniref:F-box/LRR-repeat protein fbxl-1-like n=1 Tax=Aricia agestis TaxID=91739 RepID=UPI001C203C3B|nr:F-box/LRR-repeat protein fbxl-1-like [Aricia agestis]